MKTVNQLIEELQRIRSEFRELPVEIIAENGMYFEPEIKFQMEKYEYIQNGDKPKKIILTW